MSWKYVQYEDGKYRTVEDGGGGNVDDVEVNGVSVVNAQKVAEIKSYKEVTQAEYNALPASKMEDGVMYCITDAHGADGYPPLIYSTEEREVGVWTDGKPLYQKTIHINALPSTPYTFQSYPHGVSNIDQICNYEGVVRWADGNVSTFDRIAFFNNAVDPGSCIICEVDKTDIKIIAGADRHGLNADITVRYTKTTDTPGSGTWTTQGGFAQHYSTDEHVIGTWIDGKPFYEKTINFGTLPDNAQKSVSHDISNLKKIISVDCVASNSDGTLFVPIPRSATGSSKQYDIDITISNQNINIATGFDRTTWTAYVTLKYTKTTD